MTEQEILKFINQNKHITTLSEVMAEFPELTTPTDDIIKALENNKIKMQSALKIKLFKSNTTQSLLELNKMLDNENNNDKISEYIQKISKEWENYELQ